MHAHGHTAADDGDPVTDLLDLLQLVGNENDGIAILFSMKKLIKQFLCLLGSQHCCRLIQDQDLRTAKQRF